MKEGSNELFSRRKFLGTVSGATIGILSGACKYHQPVERPMPSIQTTATPVGEVQQIPSPPAVIFRDVQQAVSSANEKWQQQPSNYFGESDLEKVLKTPLRESSIGLVNAHLSLQQDTGNFLFAVKPQIDTKIEADETFPLFANNENILDYMESEKKPLRDFSDNTIALMQSGSRSLAVIETDLPFSAENLKTTITLLTESGVKGIVAGNEPNLPEVVSGESLPKIYADNRIIWDTAAKLKGRPLIYTPALAYFGDETFLKEMLNYFWHRTFENMVFPFDGIADHFYGGVSEILPRINAMKKVIADMHLKNIPYSLTEIGDPGINTPNLQISEIERAKNFIPQVASLAVASGGVQDMYFHAFFDGSNPYTSFCEYKKNGKFKPKYSYLAYSNIARVLSRLVKTDLKTQEEVVSVFGKRSDGIEFNVIWSEGNTQKEIEIPSGFTAYDGLGEKLEEESARKKVLLHSNTNPHLTGEVRILIK